MAVPVVEETANHATGTNFASSLTATLAGAPTDGELMLYFYTNEDSTPATRNYPGSGETEFITHENGASGSFFLSAAWRAASGDGTSQVISLSDSGDFQQSWRVLVVSGADTTTPINVTGSPAFDSFINNTETIVCPGVTTTVNDCLLVIVLWGTDTSVTGFSATGFTQQTPIGDAGTNARKCIVLVGSKATAGATGDVTCTLTGGGFATDTNVLMFAVAPSGGGGGAASHVPVIVNEQRRRQMPNLLLSQHYARGYARRHSGLYVPERMAA